MNSLLCFCCKRHRGETHLIYSFEVINLRHCHKLMCQVLEQIDKMNRNKSPGAHDIHLVVLKKFSYKIAKQHCLLCCNVTSHENQAVYQSIERELIEHQSYKRESVLFHDCSKKLTPKFIPHVLRLHKWSF